MKNLVCIVVAAIFAGCLLPKKPIVTYPAPAMPEGYVLIDAYSVGYPEDYVKFHNGTFLESIKAQVLFHNPKNMKWEPYANVSLKGTGDTHTLGEASKLAGGLSKLRYFAVRFADGKQHALRLDGAHNDLHVFVVD